MGRTFQMSQKEIDRLSIVKRVISGELSCTEGIDLLSISRRQFFPIKSRIIAEGKKGVMHRLRGRESNRGFSTINHFLLDSIDLHQKEVEVERDRFRN